MTNMSYPLTVFYDGACRMCIAQIKKFQEADLEKRLIFVDISRPDFDQEKLGLAGEPMKRYIYAKDARGHWVRGVDAFIWMWRATNRKFLAGLIGWPLVKQAGKLTYRLVSRFRYRLRTKDKICDFHCDKKI